MSREVMQQALDTAEGIVNSDWRKWHELATPEEFERWVKARADHLATALREALAQPAQQPLTDEQIKAVIASIDPDEQYMPKALRQFARAIEAAHGIKE